jgi:hypothetical protein
MSVSWRIKPEKVKTAIDKIIETSKSRRIIFIVFYLLIIPVIYAVAGPN